MFRRLDDILADSRVKAVHVLTPPAGHLSVAVACLNAGKHVLVEKPVAWRVSDINKLQSAARKANRSLHACPQLYLQRHLAKSKAAN